MAEPFCGGMSFSLNFEFEQVLANDVISPLINLYRNAKNGGKPNPTDFKLDKDFYYQTRSEFNSLIDAGLIDSQKAADFFWYLTKHGYNGLVRFNQKGHWNVPVGDYKKLACSENFNAFKKVTKNWSFFNDSFEKLDVSNANLIFADPPYFNNFNNYSGKGFSLERQLELADWLADNGKPTIVCNSATKEMAKAYKLRGFKIYTTLAPRSISRNKNDRKGTPELLAFKGFGNRKFGQIIEGIERWSI